MIASSRVTSGDSSRRSSAARAVLLDVGAGPKGADGLSQAVFRNRGRPVRLLKVVPWSRCRRPY